MCVSCKRRKRGRWEAAALPLELEVSYIKLIFVLSHDR